MVELKIQAARSDEPPNPTNRSQSASEETLEPREKSARAVRGGWRRDREVFREAEIFLLPLLKFFPIL